MYISYEIIVLFQLLFIRWLPRGTTAKYFLSKLRCCEYYSFFMHSWILRILYHVCKGGI